jgi:hypothetical protein
VLNSYGVLSKAGRNRGEFFRGVIAVVGILFGADGLRPLVWCSAGKL